MKVLDLFSGIGGFGLGLERAGMETVAFCEADPFCQRVLRKHWPEVPIYEDIRTLDGEQFRGSIDVVCGGFPCQPFSVAGRKRGTKDGRDLWPEMFRIIQQAQPTWIIGENVANFVNMAFTRTKTDLESEGYAVQPFVIPACAVGAPHRRDRVWIVAYATGHRRNGGVDHWQRRQVSPDKEWHAKEGEQKRAQLQRGTAKVSSAASNDGGKQIQGSGSRSLCGEQGFSWCKNVRGVEDYFSRPDIPKPLICRADDGFSARVDRLRALGNAVVPQVVEQIGRAIIKSASR